MVSERGNGSTIMKTEKLKRSVTTTKTSYMDHTWGIMKTANLGLLALTKMVFVKVSFHTTTTMVS